MEFVVEILRKEIVVTVVYRSGETIVKTFQKEDEADEFYDNFKADISYIQKSYVTEKVSKNGKLFLDTYISNYWSLMEEIGNE